jgi:hypothetical protein
MTARRRATTALALIAALAVSTAAMAWAQRRFT